MKTRYTNLVYRVSYRGLKYCDAHLYRVSWHHKSTQLLNLYLLSSRDIHDQFQILKNISHDATSDKLAKELGLVHVK